MAILKVPGRAPTEEQALVRSPFHQVRKDQAVEVKADRDAGLVEIHDARPDDLVELHFDDGSVVVTTCQQLRERVAGASRQRSGDADIIPALLDLGATERGAGAVALKLLRVFKVDPVAAIADLTTAKAIAVIESQLAGPPGLYRLRPDGTLGPRIDATLDLPEKPVLVLLHGTASSTMGSFSGLFGERVVDAFKPSSEWKTLRDRYGDRIFALEHHTLSASPAANALELARLLPENAKLHLVSHSRGGLIGELLCRGGFDDAQLKIFRRDGREQAVPGELAMLAELGEELARKRLRVERFVRVACPAAGTLLASDRLDLFLSVLLSVLKYAATAAEPFLELLEATLLEVARRRARPEELPGLEAQRPESPYAHFLNRPQESVDQDLAVIAGDLRRGNVLQSLRAFAGYGFFWQKNDLVVHTRAMYAGLPRKKAWVSYHESAGVTHFTYFREASSRARLVAALTRADQTAPAGFEPLQEALAKQSFSALRGGAEGATGNAGTVLFLPDVFATRFAFAGTSAWPSVPALALGGLGALRSDQVVTFEGIVDESPIAALAAALGGDHRVEVVPYDWRAGSNAAADALAARLATAIDGRLVGVVAHGLGALGVLEALRRSDDAARSLEAVPIVLAAPPLAGSEAILRLWLGDGRLFAMLQCLDEDSSASDITSLFKSLGGIAELLPDRCLDPRWWDRAGATAPDSGKLVDLGRHRQQLANLAATAPRLSVLLGTAEATPTTWFGAERRIDVRDDGDGWMLNPTNLPEARVWFVPALHERVLLHPTGAGAAADLLRNGSSTRAPRQAPATRPRRQAPPFVFPSQADLEGELMAADVVEEAAAEVVLNVQVAHGSIDRLEDRPVLVGHYAGEPIAGAEAFLDWCLTKRLSEHYRLGVYPGAAGTTLYVAAPGCGPPAALVIGLGEFGELTSSTVSLGVERAVLRWALSAIEPRSDRGDAKPKSLPLASLLIGTRGGSLSPRQSMVAILRGVLRARRALALARLDRRVSLDDVVFVELWADLAINAAHRLMDLQNDAGLGLAPGEVIRPAPTLLVSGGGRGNSLAYDEESAWWRRIVVSEEGDASARGLRFVTLGERSRAEDRLVFTQGPMVDELLGRAPMQASTVDDGALSNALFELLLPVALKETMFEGRDLLLVVDARSGRYPWELLGRRQISDPGSEESSWSLDPLISRVRLIRQFRTPDFREFIAPARSDHALVIGEPAIDEAALPPLPGARREAETVVEELERRGYSVEPSVNEAGVEIVQKLFLREYRVLHVAAHGIYQSDRPGQSGVIIGRNADRSWSVLSAHLFKQLRTVPELVFLNCCHLGRLDQPGPAIGARADVSRIAASVAEALMGIGVRCVVVAGWAVDDNAANTFARHFYGRLLDGESYGAAVHEARNKVWSEHRETTTWGAYQCYGDPSFRLRLLGAAREKKKVFVSASELEEKIAEIAAATTSAGTTAEYLDKQRVRLEELERVLEEHPKWKSGRLLHEMARAWRGIGEYQRAISRYRAALLAKDGTAPLTAAEQLSNLLDRMGSLDLPLEGAVAAPPNRGWARRPLADRDRGRQRRRCLAALAVVGRRRGTDHGARQPSRWDPQASGPTRRRKGTPATAEGVGCGLPAGGGPRARREGRPLLLPRPQSRGDPLGARIVERPGDPSQVDRGSDRAEPRQRARRAPGRPHAVERDRAGRGRPARGAAAPRAGRGVRDHDRRAVQHRDQRPRQRSRSRVGAPSDRLPDRVRRRCEVEARTRDHCRRDQGVKPMPHVTFVHGLANKPPHDVLLESWLGALKGRFGGGLDLAGANVTSEMVYWADVLYPQPAAVDEEESDESSATRDVPDLMPPLTSLSAGRAAVRAGARTAAGCVAARSDGPGRGRAGPTARTRAIPLTAFRRALPDEASAARRSPLSVRRRDRAPPGRRSTTSATSYAGVSPKRSTAARRSRGLTSSFPTAWGR